MPSDQKNPEERRENAVSHHVYDKLSGDPVLSTRQRNNVDTLVRLSDTFHRDANLPPARKIPASEQLLVLESGHQPNFLPYPGVWKKVFLLQRIKEYLISQGREAIAVFGFADQNLSTARLLYENRVPAVNRQGSKKFGFKIPGDQKWKCFNTILKPGQVDWDRELSDLRDYYLRYLPKNDPDSPYILDNIENLSEIMERCYRRSSTMADLNAFIFAGICREFFDLDVHFFRYSDVQRNHLFIDEWEKIFDSLPVFTTVYTTTVHEKELDLPGISPGFFPFWFHCACGRKVALSAGSGPGFNGTCPECKIVFSFMPGSDDLAECMKNMGLSAVARNVIFSEGLGTRLFISGSGGGLRYGRVANEISRKLSMNIPVTLSWQSRDFYIGVIHRAALKDTLRLFNLKYTDLISDGLNEKIAGFRTSLQKKIETVKRDSQQKKELDKYTGLWRSSATQLAITGKTFSTIPSIIDVLVNFDAPSIVHHWNTAITNAEIKDDGEILFMKQDITYGRNSPTEFALPDIPRIYHSLEVIDEL